MADKTIGDLVDADLPLNQGGFLEIETTDSPPASRKVAVGDLGFARITKGLYAARPSAATLGAGNIYVATDVGNEMYLSDGSTYTVVGGGGTELGYAEITTNFTTTSTSAVDITGLSLTLKFPERPVVMTFQGSSASSVTNGFVIITFVANGVVQSAPAKKSINAGDAFSNVYEVHVSAADAGLSPGDSCVFKLQAATHPSTASTVTIYGAASPRQVASLRVNAA